MASLFRTALVLLGISLVTLFASATPVSRGFNACTKTGCSCRSFEQGSLVTTVCANRSCRHQFVDHKP